MMKLSVTRVALHGAFQRIVKAVESRSAIPILSHVLLEASGGVLLITGTDLDTRVQAAVAAEVEEPGSLTLHAATFAQAVAKLPSDACVVIEQNDSRVAVRAGRWRSNLSSLEAADFPPAEVREAKTKFTMKSAALASLLGAVEGCVARETERFYLNGVYLHIVDGDLCAVATDGYKLALNRMSAPAGAGEMQGVILPKRTVSLLTGIADKDEGSVDVAIGHRGVSFGFCGMTIASRVIDATFPDYARVIPSGARGTVKVDRLDLIAALERVSVVGTKSGLARLAIADGEIDLMMRGDGEDSHDSVPASYDGAPIQIGFKCQQLAQQLATLKSEIAEICLVDPKTAAVIRPAHDAPLTLLLMPLSLPPSMLKS